MDYSDYKERNEELAAIVSRAMETLKEAEAFADKYGLSFHFSPTYGMGGRYVGDLKERETQRSEDDDGEDGWFPSSTRC